MHIQVLTQETTVAEVETDSVTILTESGEITVLPGHIPLFSKLKAGQLVIRNEGKIDYLAVHGGFVDVSPTNVRILADSAIHAADIDELQAKQAIADAKRAMSEKKSDQDFTQASIDLQRAMLQLETFTKWRKFNKLS